MGVPLKDFTKLKFKVYTFITEHNHEHKKVRGIKKNSVDDKLKYEDCKTVWFSSSCMKHEMDEIHSRS